MLNKAIKKAKENKQGFTLAELLIVVAIIAVLVAISIPIFTSQLEKSKEATDAANLRAAYAECAAAALTETEDKTTAEGVTVTVAGDTKVVTCTKDVKLKQSVSGWVTTGDIAGVALGENSAIPSSGTVTVSVTSASGTPTFSAKTGN